MALPMTKDDLSDWGDPFKNGNGDRKWKYKKERILFFTGLGIILASFVNSEILGGVFHYEYLIVGTALCGISVTLLGDKK